MTTTPLIEGDLATVYRQAYRAEFREDVAAGVRAPFLVPLCFLATHAVPALYLALPHRRRPWLYRARWLVLAACAAFNLAVVRYVSSVNFATAYGVGLIVAWGSIWNLTLLVWTRPQWDAKRVERLPAHRYRELVHRAREGTPDPAASGMSFEREFVKSEEANGHSGANGHANGHATTNGHATPNGHATTNGHAVTNGHATANGHAAANGDAGTNGLRNRLNGGTSKEDESLPDQETAIANGTTEADIDMDASQKFVYVWQSYPEDAPFLTRLGWSFDIVSSLRLTGWNWALRVLPPYVPPPWTADGRRQLSLDALPGRSREGFARAPTRARLLRDRLSRSVLPGYLVLDLCAVYMLQDPYFVSGPEHAEPLPRELAALTPAALALRRSALAFAGVLAALWLAWDAGALGLAFAARPLLGFRADPWHLPSMGGAFANVLDRGLAGFWGAWWHQSFRFGFAAPTGWLVRRGLLVRGSPAAGLVGALVAFLQSGFIHALGSYTTVPRTKPWEPVLFFLLSGLGAQLQYTLSRALRAPIARLPRWLRRAGNLVFVFAWLHVTCPYLLDDFSRCGLWLWEPVPFSFVRWAGFGLPGDNWWRWDREHFPYWYSGDHWWTTGWGI